MDSYEGFDEFVTTRTMALSRVAFLLTGDHHLAQDLLQVALAQVASRWPQVRDGNPEAYVRRCLINEMTSWWRRRRYRERPTESVVETPGAGDLATSVVRRVVVGRALARLTPRQRAVLRYYEDLSAADTAEIMGVSIGTVKSQTSRHRTPAGLGTGARRARRPDTEEHDMNELRDLLADYAEQARPYEVRVQALRHGRRRRRLRRIGPAAMVLAAVGTLGATGLGYLVDDAPPAGSTATEPTATGPVVTEPRPAWPVPGAPPLPSLPATLVDASDPAPLPTDHGVAPGLVLDSVDGVSLVTTRDGNQYRLDGHPRYFPFDLSPDGRWLTTNPYRTDQTNLRDLTGTLAVDLNGAVAAWSPDGHWLLLGNPYTTTDVNQDRIPPNQGVVRLVDLTATPPTATDVDLSACSQCQFVSVRADGDVVLTRLGGAELGHLIVADRTTGALSPVDIDLTGHLSADELAGTATLADDAAFAIGGTAYRDSPDGTILLPLRKTDGSTGDILVLDLDSASVLGRWHLSASDPAGDWWFPSGMWAEGLPGVYAEGILLTHDEADRPAAWELFDPTTGALITEVTNLRGLSTSAG